MTLPEVRLRKITERDASLLVKWRNANAHGFPPRYTPLTEDEHDTWYYNQYLFDPVDQMFMVLYHGIAVGTIAIRLGNEGRPHEIHRVMIGEPPYARRGLMSAAVRKIMETFGRGWYELEVLESNFNARDFYEKNGFMNCGVKEKSGIRFCIMSRGFDGPWEPVG